MMRNAKKKEAQFVTLSAKCTPSFIFFYNVCYYTPYLLNRVMQHAHKKGFFWLDSLIKNFVGEHTSPCFCQDAKDFTNVDMFGGLFFILVTSPAMM